MERVYQAYIGGMSIDFFNGKMPMLEERKKNLQAAVENAPPPAPVYVHPQMASRYAEAIEGFLAAVNDPEHRTEAAKNLRTILEKIVLTPNLERTELVVDIVGELSGILHVAEGHQKGRGAVRVNGVHETLEGKEMEQVEAVVASSVIGSHTDDPCQGKMVAGMRNHLGLLSAKGAMTGGVTGSKGKMVAGAGFEPAAFRL